jgi:hypothetical protein
MSMKLKAVRVTLQIAIEVPADRYVKVYGEELTVDNSDELAENVGDAVTEAIKFDETIRDLMVGTPRVRFDHLVEYEK